MGVGVGRAPWDREGAEASGAGTVWVLAGSWPFPRGGERGDRSDLPEGTHLRRGGPGPDSGLPGARCRALSYTRPVLGAHGGPGTV